MTIRLRCAALCLVAAPTLWAPPAAADVTKAQCIQANTEGQSLRRAGRIAEAREQLRICGDPRCPGILHTDCTKRLDELEEAQPTVVFHAKDGSGQDLSAVKVAIDGRPLADKLDGTALLVDPGEHVFTFTAPGEDPVTKTFVLQEGAKGRQEQIVIGKPAPPGDDSRPPPVDKLAKKDEAGGMGAQKFMALTVGVVGVAGVAVGAIFGATANSQWSQAQNDCGSGCGPNSVAQGQRSDALSNATVSTVGFGVGAAAIAASLILWLSAPSPDAQGQAPSAHLRVAPSYASNRGALLVHGEF
jgi:hypothetical protein